MSAMEECTEQAGLLTLPTENEPHQRTLFWPILAVWSIFVAIASSSLTVTILQFYPDIQRAASCEDLPRYEPLASADFDRSFHVQTFSSFNLTASPYTEEPGPEVDATWEALGIDYRAFVIPVEEGLKYGLDVRRHVWMPESILGQDAYGAVIETMHELHCLNEVRKNLWFNRPYYEQFEHPKRDSQSKVENIHTNHCLDALRERLMCTADIGIVPFVWYDKDGKTWPDFARPHMCHDFEVVRRWAEEHQIPEWAASEPITPPQDAIFLNDNDADGRAP